MSIRYYIIDRADNRKMTEAELFMEDGKDKVFTVKDDESEAQDVAAEYEYACIGLQRIPADIEIIAVDVFGNIMENITVL